MEQHIRTRRIKEEWTQDYVGQQVGITRVAVHDIETGRRKPSYRVLLKLLTLFGMENTKNEIEKLFAGALDCDKI